MRTDPIVSIRGVSKRYRIQRSWKDTILRPRAADIRVALESIDLSIAPGECFGVLGQNGAGKSTLFKILATLVLPDEGEARVAGRDVVSESERVREVLIPVIPADRSLYWRVSAEENLRLYASLYGLSGALATQRIKEVLEVVGLDDVGRKQVGLFSSGMKQRLLIARALMGRPSVLLLDEPTRSLDPVSAREFRAFLRRQVRGAQNTTILLATHDHEEVTELCDRVAVLDRGRLLAVGETDALLSSASEKLCSIWTTDAEHPALASAVVAAGGTVISMERVALGEGADWSRVRVSIPADENAVADLLRELVLAGITISRFTRDDLTLADLLERVRRETFTQPAGQPA